MVWLCLLRLALSGVLVFGFYCHVRCLNVVRVGVRVRVRVMVVFLLPCPVFGVLNIYSLSVSKSSIDDFIRIRCRDFAHL